MYDIVGLCQDRLREAGKTSSLVVGYGHLGDGSILFQVFPPFCQRMVSIPLSCFVPLLPDPSLSLLVLLWLGNLHLNIASPKFDAEVLDIVEPFVFEWTGM